MPDLASLTPRTRGLLTAAVGVGVLSFDSLLVRLAHTSAWNIVFWRGLLIALSLGVLSVLGRRLFSLRGYAPVAAASALLSGLGASLFVLAVMHTRVANAVVILSAAPLCAALFTRLFLKEAVPIRTWIAIAVAMIGISVVFAGSLGSGDLIGNAYALSSATAAGGNLTLLRRHPSLDRIPLVAGGGLVALLLALPAAQPFSLGEGNLWILALMGLLQMPLAMVLMSDATRYLPSAEVALFLLVEAVLGTLWVWWALGEAPPEATFLGGTAIILTLAIHAWLGMRAERHRRSRL